MGYIGVRIDTVGGCISLSFRVQSDRRSLCDSHLEWLTTRDTAWYIIVVHNGYDCLSVCLYVCLSDDKCRKPWPSFSHTRDISREYRSSSYMKFIGPRSRSQEQKDSKSQFPHSKFSPAITRFYKIEPWSLRVGFRLWRIEWRNAIFVTWPEVTTRN